MRLTTLTSSHLIASALLTCSLLTPVAAQATDIGLTSRPNNPAPVIYGQECGAVTCGALPAGTVPAGSFRNFTHGSAPQTAFMIGISLPGPCATIPGIDNPVMLHGATLQVVTVGLTSAPPFVPTPCNQGLAGWSLNVPNNAPTGLVIRVQSVGVSNGGQLGFGPALDVTVQ